jgi:hypothetical protein
MHAHASIAPAALCPEPEATDQTAPDFFIRNDTAVFYSSGRSDSHHHDVRIARSTIAASANATFRWPCRFLPEKRRCHLDHGAVISCKT